MNLGRKNYWLAGAALATCVPATAIGQTMRSDEIVVVGRTIAETLPQELAKYGSDVEIITSEEIRNASQVDVPSTLQMSVPGVFVSPGGSSGGGPFSYLDISLQGSRTQDMLFLVDGVRINNRLYSGTTTDTLPSSMVERIEVLKGGQGLFYGTNAAAGVINVVTRGYTDDLNGLATIGGDTNDSVRADGYVRGKAGPGNFVLYASHAESDGYRLFDNVQPSVTDQDRGYNVQSYGVKYRLALSDNLSIDARYQHNDAKIDFLRYNRTVFSENRRDEEIASLGIDFKATDNLQFLVKGYWHDWDTRYDDIRNSVLPPYTQATISDNLYWGYEDKGINALAKFTPGGPFEYLAGYDYQQYSALDEVYRIEQIEESVNAFFGQIRTSDDFIENARFAAGVRHDKTGGSESTTWNVSGRYDFTPAFYAQGILGTSFLLPTAEQLFLTEPGEYLGNPNVEPEESENLNLSVGGQVGTATALKWEATYFARNINNLIDGASFAEGGINTAQPFRGFAVGYDADYAGAFYNVDGEVQVRGFELSGALAFEVGLALTASYTHADSKIEGGASQLARIPQDYVKAGVNYTSPSGRYGLGADILWVGTQEASAGAFGVVNYGDYTVFDLASYLFIDADKKHKLIARLQNALDENYATRVAAGVRDTGGAILVSNRGVPQTFHLSYAYQF